MLSENKSLLLDRSLNQSVCLQRNIKVKSSKLPYDFFNNPELNRYSRRQSAKKKSIAEEATRQTYTPSFSRNENLGQIWNEPMSARDRKIGTARNEINKDDSLIQDVISTTKNIRRVFRRNSLELVRQSNRKCDVELQLPKIANPRRLLHKI